MRKYLYHLFLLMMLVSMALTASAIEAQGIQPGQLEINSHVIHDTRENVTHQRSIGHELVPDLFLGEKTEREAMRREANREQLDHVRENLFIEELPLREFSTAQIVGTLFTEDQPLELGTVRLLDSAQGYTFGHVSMPGWLMVILLIVGFVFLIIAGIAIGQYVAKALRKRKKVKG